MSIETMLKLSDTDVMPTVKVGAIVVSAKDPKTKKQLVSFAPPMIPGLSDQEDIAYIIPRNYGYGVVISMNPFIIVSESANMRWTTITEAQVKAVGYALDDVVARLTTARLNG